MTSENIGRYKIKDEIGRGGMATVYRAVDPNFEREVAIKILPRAFLHDELFRARFEREAKTIAALEHGSIVPVYDFGEEDEQPYIVMRMMHGGSLGDKLEEGAIPLERSVEILSQLAPALDAAHRQGIIHRDLKPGNILFDRYDNAYLSDFGIARLTEASHTLTGESVLGTPAYMSPEQVQGDKEIDGRSDLYALGIVFYQMLTGSVPYQATTPAKVMMMHVLEPVPDLTGFLENLPPSLELWFSKVLAKDPEDRFANGAEMLEALKAVLEGESHPTLQQVSKSVGGQTAVSTPRPDTVYPDVERSQERAEKPKTRKRPVWLLGVLGALLVFSLAGIGYLVLKSDGPLNIMAYGQDPTEEATKDAFIATAVQLTAAAFNQDTTDEPTETVEQAAAEATATLDVTPEEATEAPAGSTDIPPTSTPTEEAPAAPVVGGADKIAFLNENEIWVMNVDGSDLQQITDDGAEKHDLSWDPRGDRLYYISGRCIWHANAESGELGHVACFETARFLDAFVVSPDAEQVAISLNRELYLVPFDMDLLKQARYRTDLQEMSECEAFSPWMNPDGSARSVLGMKWTSTKEKISVLLLSNQGGIQGEVVQILNIGDCDQQPDRLDEFPSTRFTIDNYEQAPFLQNYTYDGGYLYALTSYIRNDGYGDLYIYNADLKKANVLANPIDGQCCYRDPHFSPDGRYLIFAYQPFDIGATADLYLIPYATVGTGARYEPIPLPENFFSDEKARPEPVLRPVSE